MNSRPKSSLFIYRESGRCQTQRLSPGWSRFARITILLASSDHEELVVMIAPFFDAARASYCSAADFGAINSA
jgi:hypothetical protein